MIPMMPMYIWIEKEKLIQYLRRIIIICFVLILILSRAYSVDDIYEHVETGSLLNDV